jgi:TP901 family phage tail tape measure protein
MGGGGTNRIELLVQFLYKKYLEDMKKDINQVGKEGVNLNINFSPDDLKKLEGQIDKVQYKWKTFSQKPLKINTDLQGLDKNTLDKRVAEIRSSVDKLAKVSINTDGKGKIKNALIEYRNEMGKIVRETMEWETQLDKANNTMKKIFKTTNINFVDNIKEAKVQTAELLKLQEKYNTKSFDLSKRPLTGSGKVIGYKETIDSAGVTKFTQTVSDGMGKINEYSGSLDKANKKIDLHSKAIKEATRNHMGFSQEMSIAIRRIAEWAIATTIVYGSLRKLQEGVRFVYDLSNSLNQIRIVTGQSADEVNRLAKSFNEIGIKMGATTKEITDTSVELYRQGLSQGEIEDRMEAIIKYAKISNISLEDSNRIITATANATGESVNKIIDIFALLGDKTASGADEIGEALQKVAGTAESMSVPIEKASAWIATISSKTRESASVIGNSLKSMMARYAQIKAEGFNSEDATKLNEVTMALKTAGIIAVDSQGQLRNFGEVIDELMPKWSGLNENTKRYIATTLGGTFQLNRFITLMENSKDAFNNYEIALSAAGTAQQKFDIYMESNAAKASIFKATMDKLWLDTFNSESIGKIIEFGTMTVNFIDKIGLLNIAIGVLSIAFIAFSNSIGMALMTLSAYIKEFGLLETMTLAFNPVVAATVLAIGGFAIAMSESNRINKEAKERVKEVDSAYSNFNKTLDSEKIDDVKNALQRLTETVDYDKAIKKIQDLKGEIAGLQALADNSPALGGNLSFGMNDTKITIRQAEINRLQKETNKVEAARRNYEELLNAPDNILKKRVEGDTTNGNPPPKKPPDGTPSTPDYEKPYQKQYQTIKNLNYELERQQEILSQTEDLDKIPILSDINDKLKEQQVNLHALNEQRRKELETLKPTDERYQELIEKLQDTSLEWWRLESSIKGNEKAIKDLNIAQEKAIENQIKETIELEKKLRLQQAENHLKEELLDLEQEIYGTTQDEWEETSNARIEKLENELDLIDEKADKEKESEERAERLLEIAELELKLKNLQEQETVQQFTKDSNGNWQFDYVANQEEIESVQKELKEKQEDFDEWEEQNRLERKRKKIQSQIDEEQELQKIKKDSYEKQKKELENAYETEKSSIESAYFDIDGIVATRMNAIKATHNAKLNEMLVDAQSKLSTLKRLYEQALDMQSKIEDINVDSNDSSDNNSSSGGSIISNIWGGFKDLLGFSSGGYTGNNEGIAYLHDKELVLNKLDTANLLKAVDITRNLVQSVKLPSLINKSSNPTQQIFQISKIEFPNATDTASIQEAILTLPQIALQRVHSK